MLPRSNIYHPGVAWPTYSSNELTRRTDGIDCRALSAQDERIDKTHTQVKWPGEMHHHITSHSLSFRVVDLGIRSAHRRPPRCHTVAPAGTSGRLCWSRPGLERAADEQRRKLQIVHRGQPGRVATAAGLVLVLPWLVDEIDERAWRLHHLCRPWPLSPAACGLHLQHRSVWRTVQRTKGPSMIRGL